MRIFLVALMMFSLNAHAVPVSVKKIWLQTTPNEFYGSRTFNAPDFLEFGFGTSGNGDVSSLLMRGPNGEVVHNGFMNFLLMKFTVPAVSRPGGIQDHLESCLQLISSPRPKAILFAFELANPITVDATGGKASFAVNLVNGTNSILSLTCQH